MNEPNFIHEATGVTYYIPKFRIRITAAGPEYIDSSTGQVVQCADGLLVPIDKAGDYKVATVSGSKEQKVKMQKHLKKRAKEHFKKDIAHTKDTMIKSSIPPR